MKNVAIVNLEDSNLANQIADTLKIDIVNLSMQRFKDGEINCQINESVRGKDIFVITSLFNNVNDKIMSLMLVADALKRSSARSIIAIVPYLAYSRQDRMNKPHSPISAKVLAKMISNSGIDKLAVMDLHADQIQGFYDISVDILHGGSIFADYISNNITDFIIASPDVGGAARARKFSNMLNGDKIVIIDKNRPVPNESEVMNVIGDVKNKNVILFDDMIDTAGTICHAAEALKKEGALKVMAVASHGLFNGDALEKIKSSSLDLVLVSDSIELASNNSKIKHLSCTNLLATYIYRHYKKNICYFNKEVNCNAKNSNI